MNTTADDLRYEEIDTEQLRPQDDDQLARLLEQEEFLSWGYRHDVHQRQADGLGYYLADKDYLKYTRVSNRGTSSQMISKDVAECIDDLVPDMARALLSNDQLVEFESGGPDDNDFLREATKAINDKFRSQEDFPEQLQDFIKDGLLQKLGLFEIVTLHERRVPEHITGATEETIQFWSEQSDVDNVEVEKEEGGETFKLTIWRKIPRQFRVDAVRPEDLLINQGADTLDQSTSEGARYVAIKKVMSVASAMQQWPEKADLFLKAAGQGARGDSSSISMQSEQLQMFREWRGEGQEQEVHAHNLLASDITILREYYRCDLDRDNYPELNMIIRVGHYVIHKEPVQDNDFAYWCPYRIPHAFWGESQADKIMNIQDLRTSFLRVANDGSAYAARPRVAYNHKATIGGEIPTLSDLLRSEPGAPIRAPGNPAETIQTLSFGDVTSPAMKMLEYSDYMKEAWSGQSRRSRGLDPEAVANESGIKYDKLLQAGNGRKEFIARNLARGIEMLARKMLRAVSKYGDETKVFIDGEWQDIDPSRFGSTMRPIVHISGAVGSRDVEIQNVMLLIDQQLRFFEQGGFDNPWVGHKEIAETIRELISIFGFRNSHRFLKSPGPETVMEFLKILKDQQEPDPSVQVANIEAEVKELEAQAAAQMDKYRLDQSAATEKAKVLAAAKLKLAEINSKETIEEKKLSIDRMKLQLERHIKTKQLEIEAEEVKVKKIAAKNPAKETGK